MYAFSRPISRIGPNVTNISCNWKKTDNLLVKCYSLFSQLFVVKIFTTKSSAINRHFWRNTSYTTTISWSSYAAAAAAAAAAASILSSRDFRYCAKCTTLHRRHAHSISLCRNAAIPFNYPFRHLVIVILHVPNFCSILYSYFLYLYFVFCIRSSVAPFCACLICLYPLSFTTNVTLASVVYVYTMVYTIVRSKTAL